MPVFDFSNTPDANKDPVCTYTTFRSNESVPSAEHPIMLLGNREHRQIQRRSRAYKKG